MSSPYPWESDGVVHRPPPDPPTPTTRLPPQPHTMTPVRSSARRSFGSGSVHRGSRRAVRSRTPHRPASSPPGSTSSTSVYSMPKFARSSALRNKPAVATPNTPRARHHRTPTDRRGRQDRRAVDADQHGTVHEDSKPVAQRGAPVAVGVRCEHIERPDQTTRHEGEHGRASRTRLRTCRTGNHAMSTAGTGTAAVTVPRGPGRSSPIRTNRPEQQQRGAVDHEH